MKILIVNTYDIEGGAARAAYRLHRSLLNESIESQMVVVGKRSDDYTVIPLAQDFGKIKNRLRNYQFRFMNQITKYPNKTKTYFSTSFLDFSNIVEKINALNPDIVHLHWICNEMIKIEDLAKIKAPIVWSLHDMWAFTGGCHYDEECGRYRESCGQCKVLGSKDENDLSRMIFKRKQQTFSRIDNMRIIGLSQWLSNAARESTLFKDKHVVTLPNPIDTNKYKPVDKTVAREIFSLPQDKKLLLFGAMGATSDPRKGFHALKEAINMLERDDVELIVFGSSAPKDDAGLKYKTHYLGPLHDDVSLEVLYSTCDVMIVPSLQENLSNAIMESLSCATPVVGFNIGGNSDMIDHKVNGYLATPFEAEDLKMGIEWVLDAENYEVLCENARKKVLEKFDSKVVAKQYVALYEEVLNASHHVFNVEYHL